MMTPLAVLKFGSSVLRDVDSLDILVDEVYRFRREGFAVIAVVSALAGETEKLEHLASELTAKPDDGARATLLSAGETKAIALSALALDSAGVPAVALTVDELGLLTKGPRSDADPVTLDRQGVEHRLRNDEVVVVPGFLGRDANGAPSLLGRGGSDSTAVFLAAELGARRTVLIKDCPGVFEWDPNLARETPRRFLSLHLDDASRLSGGVVHQKAIRIARERDWSFSVSAPQSIHETRVGARRSDLTSLEPRDRPLRVGLAGLGTVGSAVLRRLRRYESDFEIAGILVRHPENHEVTSNDRRLVCKDGDALLARDPDVVCELMGGRNDALLLIESALAQGRHAVTANKDVIAAEGDRLRRKADAAGVALLFSATVGGALPLVEWAQRLRGRVRGIEGVLNGTSNFVLDRMAEGWTLPAALDEARKLGFAEADARADTDGLDAAHKLQILARAAFRRPLGDVSLQPIRPKDSATGVRQIATCEERDGVLRGNVSLRKLDPADPYLALRGEQNRCVFHLNDGQTVTVQGRGAGGRPTATAILGDLWEIRRSRQLRDSAGAPPHGSAPRGEEVAP